MAYKPPAFQFYAKDFLTGTSAMSNAATGAYIRLLCHAWDSTPIATLPADEYSLFKLSGADSQDEWKSYREAVLSKFEKRDGRLVNKRLMEYFVELAEHHKEMSDRGKKGAAARHGKNGQANEDEA